MSFQNCRHLASGWELAGPRVDLSAAPSRKWQKGFHKHTFQKARALPGDKGGWGC
jgi:hypothetical protein